MYFVTHRIHIVSDISGGILDIELYIVMINTSFHGHLGSNQMLKNVAFLNQKMEKNVEKKYCFPL